MSTVGTSNSDVIGTRLKKVRKCGEGGFGAVYECSDEYGNHHAIKVIKMDEKYGIQHPLEFSIMTSIKYPYLNGAKKIQVESNKVYIYMDLAKSDLSKIVRLEKNPEYVADPQKVRKWLLSVVLALSCLHSQRIVHADVKASNVLLFNDDTVRLADFSLVVKLWKADTKYRHTVGTATHRPLENLLERGWDTSLDIWSLGVTIYEIVYGSLLFPYQGTFSKIKNKNGKYVDEYLAQRYCNCLIDWAERGPRKQSCNIPPFKHRWNHFKLSSKFNSDPYGINDILLRMLSINPSERPTITEILNHRYFVGYQNPLCTLLSSSYEKIPSKKVKVIRMICTDNALGSDVFDLSVELYAKTMKIKKAPKERDFRIFGCIWIASKIVKKPLPRFNENYRHKILEIEKIICIVLGFKLHHTSIQKT